MHLPPPITIEGTPHLRYDDLLAAVAADLFPANGIQTQADYEQVVSTADEVAHAQNFYIRCTLHPPTVPFGQHGIYLKQVEFDTAKLITLADVNGYFSNDKPRFIVGHTTLHAEYKRLYTVPDGDVDRALDTFIAATMQADGWTKNARFDTYDRPLQIDSVMLDKATPALRQYLSLQAGNLLYAPSLYQQLYRQLFGRSYYRFTSADLSPLVIDYLAKMLADSQYQTSPNTESYFVPIPPTLPDDLPDRIRTAIDSAPTYESNRRTVIAATPLEETIRKALPTLSAYQWEQLLQAELHPALIAAGYATERTFAQRESFNPAQSKGMYVYTAVVTVQSSQQHELVVTRPRHDKEDVFPVIAPILIIDEDAEQIVALQMIGSLEAIKANFARFAGSRSQIAFLNGILIRQRGMHGHTAIRENLPLGVADWLILSQQVVVDLMNPSLPFYVLCEDNEMPPAFFPMLDRALSIPLQPHWAEHLWQAGQQHDLITITNPTTVGLRAYTVVPDLDEWQMIVQIGLDVDALKVHDAQGQPVTLTDIDLPQPVDELQANIISSYSTVKR